jgi:hypothetical protein
MSLVYSQNILKEIVLYYVITHTNELRFLKQITNQSRLVMLEASSNEGRRPRRIGKGRVRELQWQRKSSELTDC